MAFKPSHTTPLVSALILALLLLLMSLNAALAQVQIGIEPETLKEARVVTYTDMNLDKSWGFDLSLSNYGFGLGTNYLKVVGPYTQISASALLSVLRDTREQALQTWFGEVIPNKYNRVFSIPVMVGVRQRILSNTVSDNFKIFLNAEAGPSFTFIYPYFQDVNRNGIRDADINNTTEIINDVFSGWNEGYNQWGAAGLIAVGFDFGDRKQQLSVRFGAYIQYHHQPIQIMEPYNTRGFRINDPQSLFVSPMISFIVGKNWTR